MLATLRTPDVANEVLVALESGPYKPQLSISHRPPFDGERECIIFHMQRKLDCCGKAARFPGRAAVMVREVVYKSQERGAHRKGMP